MVDDCALSVEQAKLSELDEAVVPLERSKCLAQLQNTVCPSVMIVVMLLLLDSTMLKILTFFATTASRILRFSSPGH